MSRVDWPELNYDTSTGPTHHRNGIAGWPFFVWLDGDHLRVAWSHVTDDGEHKVDEIVVALSFIGQIATRVGSDGRRGQINPEMTLHDVAVDGRVAVTLFRHDVHGAMVAITDIDADVSDCRTAAFNLATLLDDRDVRFGRNSWRGDHYHDQASWWAADAMNGPRGVDGNAARKVAP